MPKLMPLKRVVTQLTHEAAPRDAGAIRKAVKSWHNRLNTGSIPRDLVVKIGRELYLKLDLWEEWLEAQSENQRRVGRPRTR